MAPRIARVLAQDEDARIVHVRSAWCVGLMDFMQMLRNIGVNLSYQPESDPALAALARQDGPKGIGRA